MVLCGTKNGFSMASLEELFEAPLFLRVQKRNCNDIEPTKYPTAWHFSVRLYVLFVVCQHRSSPPRSAPLEQDAALWNFIVIYWQQSSTRE